jgi:hypothetical protein
MCCRGKHARRIDRPADAPLSWLSGERLTSWGLAWLASEVWWKPWLMVLNPTSEPEDASAATDAVTCTLTEKFWNAAERTKSPCAVGVVAEVWLGSMVDRPTSWVCAASA